MTLVAIAISPSVTLTNPAMRIYQRFGFTVSSMSGDSAVMV